MLLFLCVEESLSDFPRDSSHIHTAYLSIGNTSSVHRQKSTGSFDATQSSEASTQHISAQVCEFVESCVQVCSCTSVFANAHTRTHEHMQIRKRTHRMAYHHHKSTQRSSLQTCAIKRLVVIVTNRRSRPRHICPPLLLVPVELCRSSRATHACKHVCEVCDVCVCVCVCRT